MRMPANKTPLISVAMGTLYRRDSEELLRRSVESILSQSFSNFELLICDDGSSQAAQKFLEGYAARDTRIRLIRSVGKLDLASKLNACIFQARGAFIARMDDDDESKPERFEKQLAFLKQHPDIAFAGSNVRIIRSERLIGSRVFPDYPQVRDFFMVQPYIHPSLMFRKGALDAVGGYSDDKRQVLCEDYDLLLRLYAAGYRGANIQEPLLDYTVPTTSKGGRTMSHRWNETVTRWERFRELGVLPQAFPFVLKPLTVGLLPEVLLKRIKNHEIQK